MAKKDSSGKWVWITIIAVLVLVGAFVYFSGGGTPSAIDYSQYAFTDAEIEKPNAAHTIEEFSDFQCPFCAQTAPVLRAVKTDFDVNVVYRHFPLSSIHPNAQAAAEASECARNQGRFWAYHDVLFDHQTSPGMAKKFLLEYAEGLGLDMEAFRSCVDNRETQATVAQDVFDGRERGITGTPTIYLDGELVNYRSYADFASALR